MQTILRTYSAAMTSYAMSKLVCPRQMTTISWNYTGAGPSGTGTLNVPRGGASTGVVLTFIVPYACETVHAVYQVNGGAEWTAGTINIRCWVNGTEESNLSTGVCTLAQFTALGGSGTDKGSQTAVYALLSYTRTLAAGDMVEFTVDYASLAGGPEGPHIDLFLR